MKITMDSGRLFLAGLLVLAALTLQAKPPGLIPLDDREVSTEETEELDSLFETATAAVRSIPSGTNAPAQRRLIEDEMNAELESFLTNHVNSAWGPSVRKYLAREYRNRGRMTQAFAHWEAAWDATKDYEDGKGRKIADLTLAYWTRMLVLFGRTDELSDLYETAGVRTLDRGPLTQFWLRTEKKHLWMKQNPERSYKCGIFALDEMAEVLGLSYNKTFLLNTPSKRTGLSLRDLKGIAVTNGFAFEAVKRTNLSSQILVPSIVHWKQDHFSPIVAQQNGMYKIVDPVGLGIMWLSEEDINAETTGYFMVPQNLLNENFSILTATEAAGVVGRGGGCPPNSENDSPPTCPSLPGDGWGGGGNGDWDFDFTGCSSCTGPGMPTWRVSEPYLNIWIEDVPLHYQPAKGPPVKFQLRNNGDGDIPEEWPEDLPRVGQGWRCEWFSRVSGSTWVAPSGEIRHYEFPSGTMSSANYWDNTRLEELVVTNETVGYMVHFPDGRRLKYGYRQDYGIYPVYYLTEQYDRVGNKLTFNYTGLNVTSITDADGNQTSLYYTNALSPYSGEPYTNLLARVVAPDGREAKLDYDEGELGWVLTNIVDAVGISNSVTADWWGHISSLTTPYGTTYFDTQVSPGTNATGPYDRALIITEPDGSQQAYLLRNDGPMLDMPTNFLSGQLPTNTPFMSNGYPQGTMEVSYRNWHNTFYWNAQQWASLGTTNFSDFDWSEYKRGRTRHWLLYGSHSCEKTLAHEQAPSPDGTTEGQITWYDYDGKDYTATWEMGGGNPGAWNAGTQIQPAVMARVMPDGSTWYKHFQRNSIGHTTNEIEMWVDGGTAHFRTNRYLYATNGIDLLAHTNALDQLVSSNVFNAFHQVTTNYDGLGQVTIYQYDDTTHLLTNRISPTDLTTSYTYDGGGRLLQVTDQLIGRTNSYTWHTDGNLKSYTDARGMTVSNFWDALNRLTGKVYPDGSTTTNLYARGSTKLIDLMATKDRGGHWTYFDYDSLRRKIAVTNANNVVTRYGYCSCGGVSSVTNAWGLTLEQSTSFDFDYQGHRIREYGPDGFNKTNWFDSLGRLITTCDPVGCRWFGYNNLGWLALITNGLGAVERSTVFDLEGRPLFVTDANGVTVTNSYDALGRVISRTYPDGGVETFGYSARGMVAYTNQLSQVTRYGYDAAGRKTFETNANNEVIQYTYSAASDLLTLVDGKNQTNTWSYTIYGQVSNKLDQAGVEILRYAYDRDGHLTNRWSVAKGNTGYSYDALGNVTNVNYPASTDLAFRYDALDRLTNMVDASGTSAYSYNAAGQVVMEDGPFASDTVTNAYTHRLRTALTLGAWTNGFGYDAARRLTNVVSPMGTWSYLVGGPSAASLLPKKITLPNSQYITNTYDSVARLTGTYLKDGSTVESATYGVNVGGQRTSYTNNAGAYYSYSYDNIGQLKVANSVTNSEDRGYAYDAAWNLNYRTNDVTTQTFLVNGKNELTNAISSTLLYDSNGNVTNDSVKVYEYDDENQLVKITQSSAWKSEFVYDGKMRLRVSKEYTWQASAWVQTNETRRIYDGMLVIQERDTNNAPTVSYVRGTDLSGSREGAGGIGGLLGRSGNNDRYYFSDGNGNVLGMIRDAGNITSAFRYDPYGNLLAGSANTATTTAYRFSSKEYHGNSGLYYYGYRWYAPNWQRWVNRDPIGEGGGLNLYGFNKNSPVRYIDGFGEWVIALPLLEIAADACLAAGGAIITVIVGAEVVERCKPKEEDNAVPFCPPIIWPEEPDYPKECDLMRDMCIGSGQDCISCWWECQRNGSWPAYKCDPTKYSR